MQIFKPGEACAHCRFTIRSCSVTKRTKETKKRKRGAFARPPQPPRMIAPRLHAEMPQPTGIAFHPLQTSVSPDEPNTESIQAESLVPGEDDRARSGASLPTPTSSQLRIRAIELTDSSNDEIPECSQPNVEEFHGVISCCDNRDEAVNTPRSSDAGSVDLPGHNGQAAEVKFSQEDVASRNVDLPTSPNNHFSSLERVSGRIQEKEDHMTAVAAATAAVADVGGPIAHPTTYGAVYAATITHLRLLRKSPRG
ncbi:hypothetical protein BKA81DRAFT_382386 [Phyllosticta paracitricarpa]|uniref:Uncharacterized protein n=1 Tax=Phyllosticta paracitricarpa TaxID=2016321 RepID=A0ABR1MU92_9PEZI